MIQQTQEYIPQTLLPVVVHWLEQEITQVRPWGIDPVTHCILRRHQGATSRSEIFNRKEGNVLCNDALNTFYLQLYGAGHMVKDHSDSERGNLLPPHRPLFPISCKGSFICTIPQTGTAYTMVFVTPVVEHWLEREIAQWVHPMKDRSDNPSHHERMLLPQSYISLHQNCGVLGGTRNNSMGKF